MFSVNLKVSNGRLILVLLIFILLVTVAVAKRLESVSRHESKTVKCSNSADVTDYLRSFGIEAGEPSVDEVTVPFEFGEVYDSYNQIQISQGFDLREFKGKTLTRYTYEVLNSLKGDCVFAEVLTFNGIVVGADIYSTELDGFISPLK